MSLSIETVCKTCRKVAPWLADGEGGFIGVLSLSEQAQAPLMGPQTFGYLYRVFEGVGIVTHDWHTFREFLEQHFEHDLVTSSDGEGLEELGDLDEPDEEDDFDEVPEGWVYATLEARCHDCRKRYRTESGAYVRAREEIAVPPEAAAELIKALPSLPDSLYRSEPFADVEAVARFFERHQGHKLSTRVRVEEE